MNINEYQNNIKELNLKLVDKEKVLNESKDEINKLKIKINELKNNLINSEKKNQRKNR